MVTGVSGYQRLDLVIGSREGQPANQREEDLAVMETEELYDFVTSAFRYKYL